MNWEKIQVVKWKPFDGSPENIVSELQNYGIDIVIVWDLIFFDKTEISYEELCRIFKLITSWELTDNVLSEITEKKRGLTEILEISLEYQIAVLQENGIDVWLMWEKIIYYGIEINRKILNQIYLGLKKWEDPKKININNIFGEEKDFDK